jgi:hypothetical protein
MKNLVTHSSQHRRAPGVIYYGHEEITHLLLSRWISSTYTVVDTISKSVRCGSVTFKNRIKATFATDSFN